MLTPKAWGFEDEIINLEYCGKRMFVNEQHRCSVHKHEVKDEVLLVAEGCLWFESGPEPGSMSGVWLQANDRVRVRPGTWHRFTATRDTVIFEFSTHHRDEDSIRHCVGGKVGPDEFRSLLGALVTHESSSRILGMDEARIMAAALKDKGRLVGMVNGCFDLLHLGHIELLRQAKFRCEVLFAVTNSDKAISQLKGPKRPLVDEAGRCGALAATRFVDYVVLCDGQSCIEAVNAIKPDVYVTTTEYGPNGPEGREAVKLGARIEVVGMVPGYSTTRIATGRKPQ
jgi:rfaE bifunctional protein nucleotidyltransferase chain/domain